MTKPYIEIKSLEAKFGSFSLGPVSFSLDQGEYLVLLGPTGCGKTSLLKCIAGYERRLKGQILINGKTITKLYPAQRKVAYVTQTSDLFPHLTVEENIAFGLRYLNITKDEEQSKLRKYIDLFGLEEIKDSPAYAVSGGEGKRCALARSLILNPDFLLLDEPIGMLDHNGRRKMLDILQMIHSELNTTTVHVTHDRHEAWGVSGKCAVMDKGKILQIGSVDDLFRKPNNRLTAEFLGCSNIFDANVQDSTADLKWTKIMLSENFENGEYCVVLRPEVIKIVESEKGKVNAQIELIRDFGEYFEINARVNSEETFTLHTGKNDVAGLSTGQSVGLDWNNKDIHLFER